jgi:hypothetical protein
MALYEVLEDSYINERLVKAGSVIDYTPPKAVKKPPANASEEEKAKPEYQDTVIGKNLRLAKSNAEPREIAAEVVTRPGD